MNNVFVYCEIEGTTVADVSLELLTKGRKLANQLGCQLEAIAARPKPCRIEKTSIALRSRQTSCIRCSGSVPLYFTAPLLSW